LGKRRDLIPTTLRTDGSYRTGKHKAFLVHRHVEKKEQEATAEKIPQKSGHFGGREVAVGGQKLLGEVRSIGNGGVFGLGRREEVKRVFVTTTSAVSIGQA